MADHCFDCAKAIRSDTTSDEGRQASWNYLQAAQKLYTDLRRHEPTRFYEEAATRLLECALGAASFLIAHADDPRISPPKDVQAFRTKCRKAGAPAWNTHPETWAAKTRQTLPVWLWWAEAKASRKLSTEPTPIWLCAAEKLDPADPASWTTWARYPRHLPRRILKHLEHPTTVARQLYLSRKDTGWLYEVLAGLRAKQTALPASVRSVARNVIKATEVPARSIALDNWAVWTSGYAENHPYDPRVSEWTALQIVAHTALAMSEVTVVAKDYPIHPANFLLPRAWTVAIEKPPSWEQWRFAFVGSQPITLRRAFRIQDSRFCRCASSGTELEIQREPVRGLGLLLLGLLRRSFEWPAAWNPSGHQQAWAGIARTLTSTVACSSWTAAIIEACVVPRVRETLLFPVLHNEEATDTQFDPPQIDTISELVHTLKIASKVLTNYQLSALNHELRQLVPISLKQLTRPNWLDDFGIASPNAF